MSFTTQLDWIRDIDALRAAIANWPDAVAAGESLENTIANAILEMNDEMILWTWYVSDKAITISFCINGDSVAYAGIQ